MYQYQWQCLGFQGPEYCTDSPAQNSGPGTDDISKHGKMRKNITIVAHQHGRSILLLIGYNICLQLYTVFP